MKVVIFAGGVGTRLWPLSRRNTPKQFEKIIGNKSMLQIAVSKLTPDYGWSDIYISTGTAYKQIVSAHLPKLPKQNIITEPEMRDVGPAVGLVIANLIKQDPNQPVALLWGSDHLVKNEKDFRNSLKVAEELILKDPERMIFIGQKPRFASQNLGYIEYGKEIDTQRGIPVYKFKGFKYRPHLSLAERFYKSGQHAWNLGYFVTTPAFLWKLFAQFAPELYGKLEKINKAVGTRDYTKVLNEVYPTVEKISFDNAILEKMDPKYGFVLSVDIGWSDIGAWEGLKEALSKSKDENVVKGRVSVEDSKDNLLFNYNDQLIVGIDLEGMLVINTHDVILVCPKDSVPKIKKFVEKLANGSDKHLV